MNETTAGVGPVERGLKPRAWAIFVDNGNARMWSTLQPHVQKLADAEGLTITPLYDQAALDAAVAAEVKAMRTTLAMVADIAHSGGLAHHTDATAMNAIRRLTLKEWNPHGTTDEHRERAQEAGRESLRRSGT